MKRWSVAFELAGKKFKTKVPAVSREEAYEKVMKTMVIKITGIDEMLSESEIVECEKRLDEMINILKKGKK